MTAEKHPSVARGWFENEVVLVIENIKAGRVSNQDVNAVISAFNLAYENNKYSNDEETKEMQKLCDALQNFAERW